MLCRAHWRLTPLNTQGEEMKKRYSMLAAFLVLFAIPARGQDAPPLKLAQTLTLPSDVKGNFDHFGVDLKGNRLFATPEGYKAVLVFELQSGKPIHTITVIGKPPALLYREDLDRIYIPAVDPADPKTFYSKPYPLLSTVKLLQHAHSIRYDPQ